MVLLVSTLSRAAVTGQFESAAVRVTIALMRSTDFRLLSAAAGNGDPGNPPGQILCNGTPLADGVLLERGFALMRTTIEGSALYDEMLRNDVCFTTADLAGHAGFAHAIPSPAGGWQWSYVVVDRDHLQLAGADILATTLVHEAAHISRAIGQRDCWRSQTCTILDNGVVLDEELEAHASEARWWIATYGADGKRGTAFGEAWENQLANAYLTGPTFFRDHVVMLRGSDPIATK